MLDGFDEHKGPPFRPSGWVDSAGAGESFGMRDFMVTVGAGGSQCESRIKTSVECQPACTIRWR